MTDNGLARYMDAQLAVRPARRASYVDFLPEDGRFDEATLWDAIAEANGLDASEISDGDLAEWL